VVAVGTTVVRALETASEREGEVHPAQGWTSLVITPERGLRMVDGLLTGLHEPHASHLAMLEALAGVCHLQMIYAEALIVHALPPTHRGFARVCVRPLITSDLKTETAAQLTGVAVEFHCDALNAQYLQRSPRTHRSYGDDLIQDAFVDTFPQRSSESPDRFSKSWPDWRRRHF
jgi:hypothetical protein